MNKKALLVSALGISAVLGWALLAPRPLYINGKASTKPSIEQGGEVYVPASSLKAAGAEVTMTDKRVSIQFTPLKKQDEQPYVEGVMGEWVTSGNWRIKVSGIKKIENPIGSGGDGFAIDFEAKNVSSKMQQMAYSGVVAVQIVDSKDQRYAVTSGSFPGYYADVQPGGGFTNHLELGGDNYTAGDPAKFIVQMDKPFKSIRIDLKTE